MHTQDSVWLYRLEKTSVSWPYVNHYVTFFCLGIFGVVTLIEEMFYTLILIIRFVLVKNEERKDLHSSAFRISKNIILYYQTM